MRALLVYNPSATRTTTGMRDVIAKALASQTKLDVEATKRRDHAGFLAAGAVHEGYEAVFVLGGDGTLNEAIQGVAGTPTKLGIIPGGSTNVWARTFGLPNDPVEATAVLLERLRDGHERTVNLGSANGRYFGFAAGYGYDAAVVRAVERRFRMKQTVRQATFLWCGVLALFGGFDRRAAAITVTADGAEQPDPLASVVVCNSDPYTFLGPLPARLCPDADLEAGLDALGLRKVSLPLLLRIMRASLSRASTPSLRGVAPFSDLDSLELRNPVPLPLQLDGDHVGETDHVVLRSVPGALTVIA